MGQVAGNPICLVTMVGARSGRRRTIPLLDIPYETGLILVASQGGAPRNPSWYYNLVADPDIEVTRGRQRVNLRARLVEGEEKAKLWSVCVERYPSYDDYQRRTTRDIPVFLCEPP